MSSINAKFRADFANAIKKAGMNANKVVRGVALQMMNEVDLRSPVDEGRFRGNNNLALNRVDSKTDYPDEKSQGGAPVSRALARLKDFKMGDTIIISNSLPYARVIEYGEYPGDGEKTTGGYSNQAPAGVYGVTALSFSKFIASEVGKLPK